MTPRPFIFNPRPNRHFNQASRAKSGPLLRVYDRFFPISFFVLLLFVLSASLELSLTYLPLHIDKNMWFAFPDLHWLDGWIRWDASWYISIAEDGYSFERHDYSNAAFFPGYPLLINVVQFYIRQPYLSGMLITLLSGLSAAILFMKWCSKFISADVGRKSIYLLYLSPFGFYLVATLYSEALFLFLCIWAWLALEEDRPVLAALIGALASVTRPVGIVLCAGLFLRALERRGVFGESPCFFPKQIIWQKICGRDFIPLLSLLGIVIYCFIMWIKFNDPFIFLKAMANGWGSNYAGEKLLKTKFFDAILGPLNWRVWIVWGHAILTLLALIFLPRVARLFGFSYFVFCLGILIIPITKTPDFYEMGRYILPAFPCFAAAGEYFLKRPKRFWLWLTLSFSFQVWALSLYSRWWFVS